MYPHCQTLLPSGSSSLLTLAFSLNPKECSFDITHLFAMSLRRGLEPLGLSWSLEIIQS
jgi:hypothetical protein